MGDAKKPGTTGPGRRFARLVGVIAAVAIGLGVLGLAVVVYVLPKMDSMAAINNHRLGDPPRPIDRSPITAEDARAALVRMTEQSDDQWMKGHAPWIADAQAHDYGRGEDRLWVANRHRVALAQGAVGPRCRISNGTVYHVPRCTRNRA